MKRAVELFAMEARTSGSPLVARTWQARSTSEAWFISVADPHWQMVVTRQGGATRLTVRGPETRATAMPIPRDAEFFGIDFSTGTFMPGLPPGRLVDRAVTLPGDDRSRWLDGSTWEHPDLDTADVFVDRLARAGQLVHDPVVAEAVDGETAGDIDGFSARSVERRVARATGLSRGATQRIRRAERAVALLSAGVAPSAVARRTGYADQPHLTRSLRRLVGQTPARIVAGVQDGSRGPQ